ADNRDVVPPKNGNWQNYTPISAFVVNADGTVSTAPNNMCDASSQGQTGTRNQNIYTALITDAGTAYATSNSKLLPSKNNDNPRGFVVSVENPSDAYHSFHLTIVAPATVTASFVLGSAVASVDVTIPPRSLTARTVWLKAASGAEKASVTVNVVDTTD